MAPEDHLIYKLDQFPPGPKAFLYGLQWAVVFLPTVMILSAICSEYLGFQGEEKILFFQRVLLTTGGVMVLQTLFGHRYPLLDGPSSALLLSLLILAPYGMSNLQGGMIVGGILLGTMSVFGLMRFLETLFTDNVIGVTLILIAITLIPYLAPMVIGQHPGSPNGQPMIFGVSMVTMIVIAFLSHRLSGFPRTLSLFLGILLGTILMAALGRLDFAGVKEARWFHLPHPLIPGLPSFSPSAVLTFLVAYIAVVINGVGSMYGIGEVVGKKEIGKRISRGIGFTGLGGILAGAFGAIGTVSFGMSPGVVLVTRVGSRFTVTLCGILLFLMIFFPKFSALMISIPSSVVGAALLTAMASQIGAGVSALTRSGRALEGRDYLVIGLPILLGGIISILPEKFFQAFPEVARALLRNGLVLGIILVLLLEHLLLRPRRKNP